MNTIKDTLFAEKSAMSLAFIRIIFGFLIFWDATLDLVYGENDIIRNYYEVDILFKYQLFEWVHPWPEIWMMNVTYLALMLFSFFVMIGFYYHINIVLTTLTFAYLFFLDHAHYLNHYYLMIVSGVLFSLLPMNRIWAVDCYRALSWKKGVVPFWSILSVAIFVEVVLIYAALAKLTPDWIALQPLSMWLQSVSDWHLFGELAYKDWFVAGGAYGSIALHLFGAPLLLYRKTRLPVFFLYCSFHLMNSYTFDIGIFPFYTAAIITIFFSDDWPKKLNTFIQSKLQQLEHFYSYRRKNPTKKNETKTSTSAIIIMTCVCLWLVIQIALPLRHFLFPGNVSWTEEGHLYSWQMKLRDKKVKKIKITIKDNASGKTWTLGKGNIRKYFVYYRTEVILSRPQMLIQLVHFLEQEWKKKGHDDVSIYVTCMISLNGRPAAALVDPDMDLTKVKWNLFKHDDWVLPLTTPLN